jgi:hypothetical protein
LVVVASFFCIAASSSTIGRTRCHDEKLAQVSATDLFQLLEVA